MKTMRKAEFLQQAKDIQVSLEKVSPEQSRALDATAVSSAELQVADLNNDGFVRGEAEWSELFGRLDRVDGTPGNGQLELTSADGVTPSPAGKTLSVLQAMTEPSSLEGAQESSQPIRARRPNHVRLNLGLPAGVGVGYSRNINPHLAVELDAGTLAVLNDVSAGVKWMTSDGNLTPTLSARYHWISNNLSFFGGVKNIHTVGLRAGLEYTHDGGFTAGGYIGASTPVATDNPNGPKVMPDAGIHLGFRW